MTRVKSFISSFFFFFSKVITVKELESNVFFVLCLAKGDKKKKKKIVKVKRKNKINTEEIPAAYTQPVDLSATFGEPQPLLPSNNEIQ